MQLKQAERVRSFLTKKDALRKLLIKFAQEEEIDAELLKKDFKVEEFEKEFLIFAGEVDCTYSCSIGYYRTENYVAIERVREKIGDTWQYVNKPVNKTRTVTDWQAHSGEKSGKAAVVLKTDGEYDKDCASLPDILRERGSDAFEEYSSVDESIMEKGRIGLTAKFEVGIELSLPGDTRRDFRGNSSTTVTNVFHVYVPYYKIIYKHKGKERTLEICAAKTDFDVVLADDEKEALKFEPRDTKALAKEEVKPKKTGVTLAWIGVPVAIIPSFFLSVLGFLAPLVMVLAIILTVKYFKAYNECKRRLDKEDSERRANVLKEKQAAVFEVLCEAIEKNELAPCAYEEVYPMEK